MTFLDFLKEKIICILLQWIGLFLLSFYLQFLKLPICAILFILILWNLGLFMFLFLSYFQLKKRLIYLAKLLNGLEKKYLITEIVKPKSMYEQLYFPFLRQAEKSMMEEISAIRHFYTEYKEYIEQWIHEMKNPITTLRLKCENDKSGVLLYAEPEIELLENEAEQILFFTRSENIEKDFFIHKISLEDVVNSAILKNKSLLKNTLQIQKDFFTEQIYSDEKWLTFILSQLIINAVQYRREETSFLHIYAKQEKERIWLKIEDNGIGILESELPRIFDKGFTGSNGRHRKYSTGLGLYLCKQLCEKLGHDIKVVSAFQIGTIISIGFSDRY